METENQLDVSDINKFTEYFFNIIGRDFRTDPEIGDELVDTVRTYKEYTVSLLKNDVEKPDKLDQILSYKIDVDDFQKYISGSVLAFFCTLASVHAIGDAKGLLSIFFKIGKKYNRDLLDYVRTIDLLCNPDRYLS